MENFTEGDLEIYIKEEPDKNVMVWSGESRSRNPADLLVKYIDGIIDGLKGKDLEIKFFDLNYINSSTVIPIIHLIKELNDNGIKSVFLYDKDSKWKLASFKALEKIVEPMEHIQVIGK